MDKTQLNNQLILCRHAVRKARVCVIHKLTRKISILRKCKNEERRTKLLKKAEKLIAEIQEMKKLKDDEVTRFTLVTDHLEVMPVANIKQQACAKLAKHPVIQEKIKSIKEMIPNWKDELPNMTEELPHWLGSNKKTKKKSNRAKNNKATIKSDQKVTPQAEVERTIKHKPSNKKTVNVAQQRLQDSIVSESDKSDLERCFNQTQSDITVDTDTDDNEANENIKLSKGRKLTQIFAKHHKANIQGEKSKSDTKGQKIKEKVYDPFFIDKKVIPPSTLDVDEIDATKNESKNVIRERFGKANLRSEMFNTKPFKLKKEAADFRYENVFETKHKAEESDLHPSWAAKKVKLIQPFQGKKWKFSDE